MIYSYDPIFYRYDHKFIQNYECFIYPFAGAASWGLTFGAKGILVGATLGAIDLVSINYKFYDHPYLTYGSIGIAAFSPLKESPIAKELIVNVEKGSLNFVRSISGPLLQILESSTAITSSPIENTVSQTSSLFNFKELFYLHKISPSALDIIGFTSGITLNRYNSIPADIFYNILSNSVIFYHLGTGEYYKEITRINLPSSQQLFLIGAGFGLVDATIVYFNISKYFIISPIIRIYSCYYSAFTMSYSVLAYVYDKQFNIGLLARINPFIPNWQLPLPFTLENTLKFLKFATISKLSLDTYKNNPSYSLFSPEKEFIPTQVSKKLRSIYSKMIEERELSEMIDKQIITLVVTKFLLIYAAISIDSNRGVIAWKISSGIANSDFNSIITDCIKTGLSMGYFYITNILDHFISEYFQTKRKYYLDDYFTEAISKDTVAIYLSRNNSDNSLNSKALINNINENLLIFSRDGNELLTSSMSVYIGGVYALNFLYNKQYDCMYFAYLYSLVASAISEFLSKEETKNDKIIKECRESIETFENHRITNAPSTSTTEKGKALKKLIKHHKKRLNIFVSDQSQFYSLNYLWKSIQDTLHYFLSLCFAIGHANSENIKKHIWVILPLSSKLFKMNCYESDMMSKLNKFNIAYENLELLLTRIESATNFSYPHLTIDYVNSNNSAICVENLHININNHKIVNIPQLCITQNKTAIVGSNGCGKTTFCKLLKNIPNYGITPQGKIIFYTKYNNSNKIIMTSQNELMIPGLSIFQEISAIIDDIKLEDQTKIVNLLNEIEFNSNYDNKSSSTPTDIYKKFNEPNNWENILSGGQKNKVYFIRTIFQAHKNSQSEYIIFDEIFEHMDSKSKKLAKAMINKYLSDKKVIIIDHNCNINDDNFYHQKITFKSFSNDFNYSAIVENYSNYSPELEINGTCPLNYSPELEISGTCPLTQPLIGLSDHL